MITRRTRPTAAAHNPDWISWLVGCALVLACAPAMCATTVTPVIIDVPSDGRAIFTVRNDGLRDVLYQITVMDWHVLNGADRYEDTQDFIASPPLFTLAPSASQIVRIGFRSPARQPVETAYRLLLAEVPQSGDTSGGGGVVNFALQYLLPVFVAPSSRGTKLPVTWSMRADGDALIVRADNPGTSRTALNMVGLTLQPGASTSAELSSKQRVTVLARSWREWRFPVQGDQQRLPWRIVVMPSGSQDPTVVPDADMRTATSR